MSTLRAPLQDRARRSLHRMLDATTELLADRPFDEISVDEIVERAGYSKGAFYHRFDSKADLLRHLIRQLTEGALKAWDEFLAPELPYLVEGWAADRSPEPSPAGGGR